MTKIILVVLGQYTNILIHTFFHNTNIFFYRNCIKTYEDGLKENLPLKNKHKLWNFYIDHVIEIRRSYRMKKETIRNFMNETMERAFQEAHDNKALLKAEYYTYWVRFHKLKIFIYK